ncbi:MAG: hypothetical protein K6E18_03660 [Lachnospiraceae bacterium]|nr:hypothetical protein [Lachnospiraceae bacterium]
MGAIITQAERDKEQILTATFDLEELLQKRMEWGLFRDRRENMYQILCGH